MMLSVLLSFWMVMTIADEGDCTIAPGELQPNGKPCTAQCCRAKGNCMYNFETQECLDGGDDPCLYDEQGNVCIETCCAGKPAPCYFDGEVRQCRSPDGPVTCHFEEYLPKTTKTCGQPNDPSDFWAMQDCTGSPACFKSCPDKCMAEPKCNYMNRAEQGCNMFEKCEGEDFTTNEARTFYKNCSAGPTPSGPPTDPNTCPCGKDLQDKIDELEKEIEDLKKNCPESTTMPPPPQ